MAEMAMEEGAITHLPSIEELVLIYRSSMEIRMRAERLLVHAYQLARLSLNAQIVAHKINKLGRPFTVIAREVSDLAKQITEEIVDLSESGDLLANNAVAGASKARLCQKYADALALDLEGGGRDMIQAVRETRGGELLSALSLLQRRLLNAAHNAQNLTRLSVHIPVVAIMFRVEAARAEEHSGTIFKGMSTELLAFNDIMSLEVGTLLELTDDTLDICTRLTTEVGTC